MIHSSNEKPTLPSHEIEHQLLLQRCEGYGNLSVKTKRVNLEAMDKLILSMLQDMDMYGDDYIPESSRQLYKKAKVPKNVYIRNFRSVYGLEMRIKLQVINDINENYISGCGSNIPLSVIITNFFDHLKRNLEMEESVMSIRIRYALRRFDAEFWEIALQRLFPVITKGEVLHEILARDMVFSSFVWHLCYVLKFWSKMGFSEKYAEGCTKLLGALSDIGSRNLSEVDNALKLFEDEATDAEAHQ